MRFKKGDVIVLKALGLDPSAPFYLIESITKTDYNTRVINVPGVHGSLNKTYAHKYYRKIPKLKGELLK